MKKLILIVGLFLCTTCFAEGTWAYRCLIDVTQDIADKYRVRVSISDGTQEEVAYFKFQEYPSIELIKSTTAEYCERKNAD